MNPEDIRLAFGVLWQIAGIAGLGGWLITLCLTGKEPFHAVLVISGIITAICLLAWIGLGIAGIEDPTSFG